MLTPEEDGITWLIDIEIMLARVLGWSLYDIDRTDISSLIPFILRLIGRNSTTGDQNSGRKVRRVYCDQIAL